MTGEDARAVAAQLRTLNVYGQQIGVDGHTRKAARSLVTKHGREGALYLQPDKARMRARLKQLGVDGEVRGSDTSAVDYATRTAALDELLRTGITGVIARTAIAFDAVGAELDKHGGQLARMRRVQSYDQLWLQGFCSQMQREMLRLQLDASIICATAYWYPPLGAVCAMIELAAAMQAAVYLTYCR